VNGFPPTVVDYHHPVPLHAVTGAFGYSGRRIAARLLDRGVTVRCLTNSPHRPHPFGDRIATFGYDFDRPERLTASLRGVEVLYNTYWIRFNYGPFRRAHAVKNSLVLFKAARDAGVRRIVHVSVANPSDDSPFEYFRGKAALERAVRESGLSYAILRPAVFFGDEDILVNNIAWMLRHMPVFGVFGDGEYGIRPIHVDDFAALAVRCGAAAEDTIIDAVGPERFTYRELVRAIAREIGVRRPIVSVPAGLGYWIGRAVGLLVGDVVLTRDEIAALMAGLLDSAVPATGDTRLSDWARQNAATLGRRYANELARRQSHARPPPASPAGAGRGAGNRPPRSSA